MHERRRAAPSSVPSAGATSGMDAEQDMVVMVARVRAVCDQSAACVDGLLEAARLGKPLLLALAHQLVDDTRSELEASDGVFLAVARLKRWHDYAVRHPVALCALMQALARQLVLPQAEVALAGLAGLLCDIGKALVPADMLQRTERLTAEEMELLRQHVQLGQECLYASGVHPEVQQASLLHHERLTGDGYPHRRIDGEIPLLARMAAICDVYDANDVRAPQLPALPSRAGVAADGPCRWPVRSAAAQRLCQRGRRVSRWLPGATGVQAPGRRGRSG